MASAQLIGTTIRTYLIDGTPQGLRLVDRSGWTGCCLAFARSDYPRAKQRWEVAQSGCYVLLGPDPEGKRTHRLYVGEADEVRTRLDKHLSEKDFWTQALVLTTKDQSLNKAHVRYLEARLLQVAVLADRATVDNVTRPPLPHLSEPEVADMEAYLASVLVLLPIVGVHEFEVVSAAPARVTTPAQPALPAVVGAGTPPAATPPTASPEVRYFLRAPQTEAEGRDRAQGFLVLDGALAREQDLAVNSYASLKQQLLRQGVLVPDGPGQLRLTKDHLFDSPSSAASVLTGGNRNGRKDWIDAQGKSLKENQEAAAGL